MAPGVLAGLLALEDREHPEVLAALLDLEIRGCLADLVALLDLEGRGYLGVLADPPGLEDRVRPEDPGGQPALGVQEHPEALVDLRGLVVLAGLRAREGIWYTGGSYSSSVHPSGSSSGCSGIAPSRRDDSVS